MGIANHRGQSAIELIMILLVLSTFVLIAHQLSHLTRPYLTRAVLSKEVR